MSSGAGPASAAEAFVRSGERVPGRVRRRCGTSRLLPGAPIGPRCLVRGAAVMGLPGIPPGNSHRVRAGDPTPVCARPSRIPPPRDDAFGSVSDTASAGGSGCRGTGRRGRRRWSRGSRHVGHHGGHADADGRGSTRVRGVKNRPDESRGRRPGRRGLRRWQVPGWQPPAAAGAPGSGRLRRPSFCLITYRARRGCRRRCVR